ncbi:hypothetical protein ATANTOWER_028973 [Ataeniobius toweri]|uniref:Uncharacterized protein n=1 Tax=Ataeniobius toweri TaxID=208326 RepID=A0ABU7A8F8_9TELE|nr:hypothetical protein [Ataeniobius toweri]
MVTEDHGVRQFPTNAHQPHRDTHDQPNRTNMYEKAHAIYRGKTPSFLLLFNPPPPILLLCLCHSHSVRTPLATMCCRQRPQHIHCLGHERRTGTRAASVCPCVCPSLPSLTRRFRQSRPLLMLRPIVPCSQSSVSISLHPTTFVFSPVDSGGAVIIKKKGNKQTPPPISLALAPSPSPASLLLQSQQLHLPICVSSARDMGGRDLSLFQN